MAVVNDAFFSTDRVWSVSRSKMTAFFPTTLVGRKFWSEMPAFLVVYYCVYHVLTANYSCIIFLNATCANSNVDVQSFFEDIEYYGRLLGSSEVILILSGKCLC